MEDLGKMLDRIEYLNLHKEIIGWDDDLEAEFRGLQAELTIESARADAEYENWARSAQC